MWPEAIFAHFLDQDNLPSGEATDPESVIFSTSVSFIISCLQVEQSKDGYLDTNKDGQFAAIVSWETRGTQRHCWTYSVTHWRMNLQPWESFKYRSFSSEDSDLHFNGSIGNR